MKSTCLALMAPPFVQYILKTESKFEKQLLSSFFTPFNCECSSHTLFSIIKYQIRTEFHQQQDLRDNIVCILGWRLMISDDDVCHAGVGFSFDVNAK